MHISDLHLDVTLWTFKTKNFVVIVGGEEENEAYIGDDPDGEIQEKLNSGEYTMYTFVAYLFERDGVLITEDSLGNSVYEDAQKFRDHIGARGKYGSYFKDMVRTVISEGRVKLDRERPVLLARAVRDGRVVVRDALDRYFAERLARDDLVIHHKGETPEDETVIIPTAEGVRAAILARLETA